MNDRDDNVELVSSNEVYGNKRSEANNMVPHVHVTRLFDHVCTVSCGH